MVQSSGLRRGLLGTCLAGACVGIIAIAPTAQAQQIAPSQVTPQSLRPETVPSATIVLPEAAGLAAPANAQRLSVDVGHVVVEGTFPELQAETQALAAGLEGRRVSVAQIYAVANAIEQRYAAAGFVLARVAVPPQKLGKHATLHLVVIDGFVQAVDVNGVPERQRNVIAARMAALVGQRHLHLTDIERRLLLVSDLPGVTLKSTLARGSVPGGTLLVLEADQHYVSGSVGVDDRLPGSLGTWELNSSLALNSAFGFGEQIYGSASTGADLSEAFNGNSPLRVLGGGVVMPIGPDGFTLNPEYTNSVTRQRPAPGAPPSQGTFERFAVRANYPVIRTREQSLNVQATWEWDEEHLTPLGFGTDLYKDRYQVLRLQAAYNRLLDWNAAVQATGTFSQGLTGRDGAQAAATTIPLSRQGSSPTFSKLNIDLRYQQALPYDLQLGLIGRAQTSFGAALFSSEQFSLDGLDALSTFAAGTFSVDQGATLRGEISHPFPLNWGSLSTVVSPYIFASGGRGSLEQPTAVEQHIENAGSFGIGLRTGSDFIATPYGSTLGVEFGRQLSDVIGEKEGYRANLAFAVHF